MSMPSSFDDEVCAGLPRYPVAGELMAKARTGDWLRTGHLVEPARAHMERKLSDGNPVDHARTPGTGPFCVPCQSGPDATGAACVSMVVIDAAGKRLQRRVIARSATAHPEAA